MKFKIGDKVKVKVDNLYDSFIGEIKSAYIATNGENKIENIYNICVNQGSEHVKYLWRGGNELELFKGGESEEKNDEKSLPNVELHKYILKQIHDTYKRKNADYGNSFGEQFSEYGLLSATIRLDDKMRRLKQLLKNEAQVKDESIEDTLLDLANYSIMTVMEMRKKNV